MAEIKEALKESSKKFGEPISSFEITYDSPQNQLEPIYYWLLDFINNMQFETQKLTDNFASSPGSGHFSDMSARASKMQEEGMKVYGFLNQTIKTIIQLLYDLKEFKLRLSHYENAKSENKETRKAAEMALKQIWMDNVDMKRGNTAIKAMAFSQQPFATLIDAFMAVKDEKLTSDNGNKIDLNERVKSILKQKIAEFNKWKELSEEELRKRYKIQKSYLRSQVETLKLQASWVRPYLRAAEKLRQQGFEKNPALVNAFSTTMFELTLLGKKKVKFEDEVNEGKLPPGFKNYKPKRDYYSCVLINLYFRGHVGQRVTQKGDYAFGVGGRVEITLDSYALNSDELELFEKELEKQDLEESFKFIENTAEESLEQLQDDIDEFLHEDEKKEEKKKQKKQADYKDPFSALFSGVTKLFEKQDKKDKKEKNQKEISEIKDIKKDNYIEKYIRNLAKKTAKGNLYTVYDIYKKAHGMASSPDDFDN